jgi:hypothetical protein
MRVYYLTSSHFAISNIALRRIKISRFEDLNDPFELLAIDLRDKEHRRAFKKTKEQINATKGLICVSRHWSNPLVWGHYAEKHTGIALGFEVKKELLAEVIYTNVPYKIPIDNRTNRPIVSEGLMDKLIRTKFFDWKYEDELRIFVQLDPKTKEAGLYFYNFSQDFQLREIILGPKCELPIDNIREMVSSFDPIVSVIQARIAHRSFRVVKFKLKSRIKK